MRKIVIYPAKILRQRTEEIKNVDKKLLSGIEDLKKILKNGDNAAGLAASQIGLNKRFFGIKEIAGAIHESPVQIFINPKIEKVYGEKVYPKIVDEGKNETDFLEGCLSFPGFFGTVRRYLKIKVRYQFVSFSDNQFVSKEKVLSGFEAIVWQHEFDHLEGIVFIDHIKEEGGKFYKDVGGKMERTKVIF